EGLQRRRVEVVRVVVDLERAFLSRLAVGDRLVRIGDRPGDRVVRPGEGEAARAGRLLDDELRAGSGRSARADRRRRVLAPGQDADPADGGGRSGGPPQQLPARQSLSVLRMAHAARRLNPFAERCVKWGASLGSPRCTRSGSRSAGATSTPTDTSTTPSTSRTSRSVATSGSKGHSQGSTPRAL